LKKISKKESNRLSQEWVIGKSKDNYYYYTVMITTYDRQLTVFNNYKKTADLKFRKDKKSWFNQLDIFEPY